MPMLSLSSPGTALLVWALVATATAASSSSSSGHFVKNPAATANAGTRNIEIDYLSSPGWGWSMKEIMSLKSTVVRFHDQLDFTPSYDVADGRGAPLHCRRAEDEKADDFFVNEGESDLCQQHCMNNGRYCDHSLLQDDQDNDQDKKVKQARQEFFAKHKIGGRQLVEESVRRLCLWNLYGKAHPDVFFQYHETMKSTGCDAKLSSDCIGKALPDPVNADELHSCIQGEKGLDPLLDEPHALLEAELQRNKDYKFEAGRVTLFTAKASYHTLFFDPGVVFREVCGEFVVDLKVDPPLICDFCEHHCPQHGRDSDDNDCVWNLKCAEGGDTFDDYLTKVKNTTAEAVIAAAAAEKEKNQQDPDFEGNVREPRTNGHTNKTVVETAGGMAATLLAMILAGGVFMMAVMAIRVWRTKVIIERYVREQEELSLARARNEHGGEYGDHNHHDDAFFPDGNELDLDLEPALQYRDHIAPSGSNSGSSGPPSSAAFLPKLT